MLANHFMKQAKAIMARGQKRTRDSAVRVGKVWGVGLTAQEKRVQQLERALTSELGVFKSFWVGRRTALASRRHPPTGIVYHILGASNSAAWDDVVSGINKHVKSSLNKMRQLRRELEAAQRPERLSTPILTMATCDR